MRALVQIVAGLFIVHFSLSATAAVPTSVRSTSNEIPVYSPQARALTMKRLCEVVTDGSFDLGKASSITCVAHPGDIIEIKGSVDGRESISVFANASDKTVLEFMGDNEFHRYQNDLNQTLSFEFVWVNTGTRQTTGGVQTLGYNRLDGYMTDSGKKLRIGFFSNLQ